MSRRVFLGRASLAATGLAAGGMTAAEAAGVVVGHAAANHSRARPASAYGAGVPAAWFDLALELVQATPGFSPPVASRAFGYTGVALYEAVAPGRRHRRSLAGRLNGLTPLPARPGVAYHWPTVASSALASILRSLFPTAPPAGLEAIAALERRQAVTSRASVAPAVHRRSVTRGIAVARHVFRWSTSDGGHEGYTRNFPPYTPPAGPGLWVPTPPAFMSALQPAWGGNRPLALRDGTRCSPEPPPAYSEAPGSPFLREAAECHEVVRRLTSQQIEIARFWADEPGVTATPAGHSLSIVTQVVRQHDIRLDRAAEAYAKVGIAVADAFVACWRTKYEHNLLRPVTCIQRVIQSGWTPPLGTPPFPEYTSGHAAQSAAAAHVLTDMFGAMAFTDRTHHARGLPSRSFRSFEAAAREAAISRLYAGIHYRSAIKQGLEQGRCVGRNASRVL